MARNKDAEAMEAEELLDEGSGPRVYELAFHLDPELGAEEAKAAYQSIKSAIEAVGSIVAEGQPQKVALAYTISRQETSGRRDFDSAYFAWIAYETDASKHAEVQDAVKGEKRVIRSLDILTTKDAARHAAEMQELQVEAQGKKEEAVSDAELDAALEEVAA